MIRPSIGSQDPKSKTKELIIGEPFEIEFFYETLASLRSDFQFRVSASCSFLFTLRD